MTLASSHKQTAPSPALDQFFGRQPAPRQSLRRSLCVFGSVVGLTLVYTGYLRGNYAMSTLLAVACVGFALYRSALASRGSRSN